jgi:dTDP-4-dehydrorhamnose 3,5-epimerase
MPFQFIKTDLDGVVLIEPQVFEDRRGYFMEFYKESAFSEAGISHSFVQVNHSFSIKNVLRGLHFQTSPKAQGKLVGVISGSIWDVAVNLRSNSPAFSHWTAHELSGQNHRLLYIPPGFAHGFLTLSAEACVMYKCTEEYAPNYDAGIRWNDPEIGIDWPEKKPLLSEKDTALPTLAETIERGLGL